MTVRYAGAVKHLDGGGLVSARCAPGFLMPPGMVVLSRPGGARLQPGGILPALDGCAGPNGDEGTVDRSLAS